MSLVNMCFLEDLHVLYIVVVNGSVLFTKERKKTQQSLAQKAFNPQKILW